MTHTFTYLDTALHMNELLHGIVAYEKDRMLNITEGSYRTQEYVRADSASLDLPLDEITGTYSALTMHYASYEGDEADNAYLALTPVALRLSIGSIGLLRAIAIGEMDRAVWWSGQADIDADTVSQLRLLSSDMYAQDSFLYGKVMEANAACMAWAFELLD